MAQRQAIVEKALEKNRLLPKRQIIKNNKPLLYPVTMPKFPEVKKTISSYVSEENGRITKHTVLTLGAIMAGAALASAKIKNAGAQTLHQHSHLSSPPPHSSHGSY